MSHDSKLKTIPAIHSVAGYMGIKNAAEAIDFYCTAFGAVEELRLSSPDGKIGHAKIRIGTSILMMSDEYPDFGALSPVSIGGSPVKFTIDTEDADQLFDHAVSCGCTVLRPVEDQFYGYRTGMVADPYGYSWFIQHKVEDLSPEEMQARWQEIMQ